MRLLFRLLTPADYPLLLEWLSKAHVRQWWNAGEDTLEKVAQHYGEEEEGLRRFILIATEENGDKRSAIFSTIAPATALSALTS